MSITFPDHIASLRASPASLLAKRAREHAQQGRDVVLFSSGELDFNTPAHVREAATRAATKCPVSYTNVDGSIELKEAVRQKFRDENDLDFGLEELLICNGSKQAMFNALVATIRLGDEVIIPSPYWVSYLDLATIAGAKPVIAETSVASDWKLTAEALEAAITSHTRWLIINNPVNPTGSIYSSEELENLAQVLRRHPQVLVMCDDLYEHIRFDDATFATFAAVASDMKDRTLTINGVSKAYAMMGWRIGYCGGARELISAMLKVQSQSTSNACTVSQAAAVAALTGPQDERFANLRALANVRRKVAKTLSSLPGLAWEPPSGTFYAFISCEDLLTSPGAKRLSLETDIQLADYLLNKHDLVVLPGKDCGLSPYIRINFAVRPELVEKGLGRLGLASAEILGT